MAPPVLVPPLEPPVLVEVDELVLEVLVVVVPGWPPVDVVEPPRLELLLVEVLLLPVEPPEVVELQPPVELVEPQFFLQPPQPPPQPPQVAAAGAIRKAAAAPVMRTVFLVMLAMVNFPVCSVAHAKAGTVPVTQNRDFYG